MPIEQFQLAVVSAKKNKRKGNEKVGKTKDETSEDGPSEEELEMVSLGSSVQSHQPFEDIAHVPSEEQMFHEHKSVENTDQTLSHVSIDNHIHTPEIDLLLAKQENQEREQKQLEDKKEQVQEQKPDDRGVKRPRVEDDTEEAQDPTLKEGENGLHHAKRARIDQH